MTDIKTSFVSSETETKDVAAQLQAVQIELGSSPANGVYPFCVEIAEEALFVVKTPRANSKLILQNMEEVLNSVKKKHRQKHRRKKEQKKLAEAEAAAATGTPSGEVRNVEKRRKSEKKRHKKPLQDKAPEENGVHHLAKPVQRENHPSPASKTSILNHFSRTPKKDADDEVSTKKNTKKTNAFEVMMSARNKSIGSNTPGKEVAISEESVATTTTNAKRKLILQEWADMKGGLKRKLDEETRAAFVDQKLEQRAKRLRKMLTKSVSDNTADDTVTDPVVKQKENSIRKLVRKSSSPLELKEETSIKRGRGRPCKFPRNSMEVKKTGQTDVEVDEFLAKLNSPTKKRDSLLGYFCKKQSPQQVSIQIDGENGSSAKQKHNKAKETPKRRRRPSVAKSATLEDIEIVVLANSTPLSAKLLEDDTNSTPSRRPQRSCAGKARYDYDLVDSPIKQSKPQKTYKSTVIEDEEVIELDDSSITPQQTPKKLAPLFVRSMPKPCQDPDVLKAREEFLRSGVPDKIRLEQIKQKEFKISFDEGLELFPQISHIHQFSSSEEQFLKQIKPINYKLRPLIDGDEIGSVNSKRSSKQTNKLRCSLLDSHIVKDARAVIKAKTTELLTPFPSLDNKRDIIKSWKKKFDRFPTYKCYNQMREKYRYFSAIDSAQDTEQVSESLVVTHRTYRSRSVQQLFDPEAAEEKPPLAAPNGELLFSEKYKPMLFEQVLVNLTPVTQLREFLANWSCSSSGATSVRNSQTPIDDSMDISGNDSNLSQQALCNSVVLLGPSSSGKTNAVFALANEMNFNVLEINAGMKRTGKRLIQELQEATQSHQIRKDSVAPSKSQKNMLKKTMNGYKSLKVNCSQNAEIVNVSSSSHTDVGQSTRKSLILIEDADIVFEQTDAGFTDAIYTLAASSKRPMIVVAKNSNCSHLQRLIQQNAINFTAPNALNITKFLAILSLIENCPINLDDLISLYLYNQKDLRKTLLELQFFIQSGGDRQKCVDIKDKEDATKLFVSPTKRQLSEDSQTLTISKADEELESVPKTRKSENSNEDLVYIHRTLFEFYTFTVNEKHRIPFPVDFQLLRMNLDEIFQVSHKLKTKPVVTASGCALPMKRKSRSPKKAWLNSAITNVNARAAKITPLDSLCEFYENTSVAALLSKGVTTESFTTDKLMPHLREQIAHELVEQAITVNLQADFCAYNLFETTTDTNYLCDNLSGLVQRTKRARYLDYEPSLRAICRSEKLRATQGRSTRFYHYLRNCSVNICNFSTAPFDAACSIFELSENDKEEATTAMTIAAQT